MQTMSDSEIIRRSLHDPERFGEIFDRHYGSICRFLRRRLGAELAEDLAVETFATALAKVRSFDLDRADARPWLFGIAANLARTHQRAERRQLIAYARSGVDPVVEDAFGDVLTCDAERALAAALAALSTIDREALLLYAWADLSYREIAEAMRIPVGTVRSRLSRARKQMREALATNGQLAWDEA